MSQSRDGQNCSGHQSGSIYSEGKITVIRELLLGAKDILELAFECDGWVFSHAGFSKTSVRYMQEILKKKGILSISSLHSQVVGSTRQTPFITESMPPIQAAVRSVPSSITTWAVPMPMAVQ